MRKVGVHKQLECHGFVCQTSEDAIVIAATLYKSLMAHMKAKEMKPKNRNGVTCMSVASSVFNENCGGSSAPVRPPRKKKSSCSSVISDRDALEVQIQPIRWSFSLITNIVLIDFRHSSTVRRKTLQKILQTQKGSPKGSIKPKPRLRCHTTLRRTRTHRNSR